MDMIKRLEEVSQLPLPETVAAALWQELIAPFEDDEAIAADFWRDTDTTLFCINTLPLTDELTEPLRFALNYPEHESPLIEDWVLLLAILNDEGSGVYVVAPKPILALLKAGVTDTDE